MPQPQAVRRGKQSKLVTNVTLSLMDANNQPAAINITDIVTNKLTAGWRCECRAHVIVLMRECAGVPSRATRARGACGRPSSCPCHGQFTLRTCARLLAWDTRRHVPPHRARQLHVPPQRRAAGRRQLPGDAPVAAQHAPWRHRRHDTAGALQCAAVVWHHAAGQWCCSCQLSRPPCHPCKVHLATANRKLPAARRFVGSVLLHEALFPRGPRARQVSFSATAGDGGTCNGTAVICSAWGVRRNQPPPACAPFNSTGVTRPALTCV